MNEDQPVSAADVARCPLRSVMVAHYKPDGSCRCADHAPAVERELTMCGGCVGSGKIARPGVRGEFVQCPGCRGAGFRP